MRQRDKERAISAIKKAIMKNREMKIKYTKKIKKELNLVGEKVIDDWYSSYIPNVYIRQYSLYKTFKVSASVQKGTFNVSFSSSYMKGYDHFTGKKTTDINEYIYDISFMQGWHGGANKGPNHPFPGIPFYRDWPYHQNWYYAAEKSFSPYEVIYEKMNDKISEIDKEYENEFMDEIVNKINHHVKILKGGTK